MDLKLLHCGQYWELKPVTEGLTTKGLWTVTQLLILVTVIFVSTGT